MLAVTLISLKMKQISPPATYKSSGEVWRAFPDWLLVEKITIFQYKRAASNSVQNSLNPFLLQSYFQGKSAPCISPVITITNL